MLEEKITDLTAAVERLVAILSEQGKIVPNTTGPKKTKAVVATKPQVEDVPTEDIKDLMLAKSRVGHRDSIAGKLRDDIGVEKLIDLTAEQAVEFYQWLQGLEG